MGIEHYDQTDMALKDPFICSILNKRNKLHQGNDTYLINSALWLRFLYKLDLKRG